MRRLECGDWNAEIGMRRLECGDWNAEIGMRSPRKFSDARQKEALLHRAIEFLMSQPIAASNKTSEPAVVCG